jgi:hypothetical protein
MAMPVIGDGHGLVLLSLDEDDAKDGRGYALQSSSQRIICVEADS